MFTGIVEEVGLVKKIASNQDGLEVTIEGLLVISDLKINDSISCSGICLTVIEIEGNLFKVQLINETIDKTDAKNWKQNTLINLERALLPTSRMGGHIVQGHVDTVVKIIDIENEKDSAVWRFELKNTIKRYIVKKGSICLDGISLTIADKTENYFSVALIPHTLNITSWNRKEIGDSINVEVDILGKYLESLTESL
jgi:riboflavin synthase